MKSAIAITSEIDDIQQCIDELTQQISTGLQYSKKSFGILFCDADIDVAALSGGLHEKMGLEILGLTTTATVERHSGYNGMGAVLCILTGDDIDFAIGVTGDLDASDYAGRIHEAYALARGKLSDDPKLIFLLAPYCHDLTSDNYSNELDLVSGGVPVFGGVATDHYDMQYQKTFLSGTSYERGIVFLLLGGNIHPVFAMEQDFSDAIGRKGVVAKSDGNQVYRVGEQSFKGFLASFGPVPADSDVIYFYQSTPFVLELPDNAEDEQPTVRALLSIDHDTEAGGFLSHIPEKTSISLHMFKKENIFTSCDKTFEALTGRMRKNLDYNYSLLLIASCNARHLLMGDDKNIEARIITEKLRDFPASLNALGFYGLGEICPTRLNSAGRAKGRFHNYSIVVCAI